MVFWNVLSSIFSLGSRGIELHPLESLWWFWSCLVKLLQCSNSTFALIFRPELNPQIRDMAECQEPKNGAKIPQSLSGLLFIILSIIIIIICKCHFQRIFGFGPFFSARWLRSVYFLEVVLVTKNFSRLPVVTSSHKYQIYTRNHQRNHSRPLKTRLFVFIIS